MVPEDSHTLFHVVFIHYIHLWLQRLPTDYNTTMNRHFMAYLYFNPIMPGPDPLEKTLYARLRMTKSGEYMC